MVPYAPSSTTGWDVDSAAPGEGVHIVYIDDEPTLGEVTDRLESTVDRFRVHPAPTIAKAEELVGRLEIDCVVSGTRLEPTEVRELLAVAQSERPALPSILFVESTAPITPSEAFEMGVSAFVAKETSDEQVAVLANRIDSAVRTRSTEIRHRESNRRLETFLGHLPGVAFRCREGKAWPMEYLSDGIRSLTGYEKTAILDGDVSYGEDIIHPADRDAVWETIRQAIRNDEPYLAEYRIQQADDSLRWVWERGRGIPDGDGVVIEGILLDVTERKSFQDELKYQNSLHEALNEATIDGHLIVESDGTVVSSNERFWEMWDVPQSIRSGEGDRTVVEWIVEQTAEADWNVQSAFGQSEHHRTETNTGEVILDTESAFHYYSTPLEGPGDTSFGRLVVFRDITERKHREEALQISEYTFQSAISGIAVASLDGELIKANASFVEMWGYEDEAAILGRHAEEFLKHEKRANEVVETIRTQGSWKGALTAERADGTQFEAKCSASAVRDEDGTMLALMSSFLDVTEQNSRKRALEEEREKYRTVAENSHDGIAIVQNERFVFVNDRFAAMVGFPEEELLSQKFFEFVAPDDRDAIRDQYRRRLDPTVEMPIQSYEIGVITNDTGIRNAAISASKIQYEGEPAVLAMVRDVTERKQRMDQIKKIDRILRHNLSNELNVVTGYGNVIRRDAPEPFASHAKTIVESSERLLSISRKERQITELLSEEPTQVTRNVVRLLETVSTDVADSYPQARIRTTLPDPPDVEVRACNHIGLAFRELLENAIRHDEDDEPRVEIEATVHETSATITVSDYGRGIPVMERDILTGDLDIGPLSHGSGMGLWMVQLIVQRSNGDLEFAENEPRGSVVTIHLPVAAEAENDE